MPENEVFPDQAVHSFQLKLLKAEINKARTDTKNISSKLDEATDVVQRGVKEEL